MSNVIEEIRSGNKEAVKQVYQEHAKDVYNFAKSITGSHETALEATKKTFMELFSRIQKGETPSNIRTAALKIAYDEACNIAMPSSNNNQDISANQAEPVFGAHRPRQKSTEELYAEVEAKRAINPTFSNTPRAYDSEQSFGQTYGSEQPNNMSYNMGGSDRSNNMAYNTQASSVPYYDQEDPYRPQDRPQPQRYGSSALRQENPNMIQEQGNPYAPQGQQNPYETQQSQGRPSPYETQQSQGQTWDNRFDPQPQENPYYRRNQANNFHGNTDELSPYGDKMDYNYPEEGGPSNFVREDIYVPKGGYESMQIDPNQPAPDFSEKFKTQNFDVVNAVVGANGEIDEYDDADYRKRQRRAQMRDNQPQQQEDYYYEDAYDEPSPDIDEEEEHVKPKKKGLFVFCIVINIILILVLIWFLVGLLINLEIISEINLGYEWFNSHIYPLF